MPCGKVWPTLFPYCPQPPLVKTQTVTISDTANAVKSEIPTKDVPIVHTETKTITYEAAQVRLTLQTFQNKDRLKTVGGFSLRDPHLL